jgi:predicted transcriptional regulator
MSPKEIQVRIQILEGLARGEADLRAGRVLTHEQAKKKMSRWLKRKPDTK